MARPRIATHTYQFDLSVGHIVAHLPTRLVAHWMHLSSPRSLRSFLSSQKSPLVQTINMDRKQSSSHPPAARFPPSRRRPGISISEPDGRSQRDNSLLSSYQENNQSNSFLSTERSFMDETSNSNMSTIIRRDEEERPSRPITPVASQLEQPSTSWPLPGLPTSRTFHIFSGLPKSLSRSSRLSSHCTDTSNATTLLSDADMSVSFYTPNNPSHTTHIPVQSSSRWSFASSKTERQHVARDPYIIYDAQPSAYWTGRFMALRDKFHSESLSPENMDSLLHANTERSKEVNQQERRRRKAQSDKNSLQSQRFNARLPPSTTSGAILQREDKQEANMLLDDDEMCRRVLVHLEAFCATDEARKSLHLWQQNFARTTGRKKLLPEGGSMDALGAGGSYFTRIIGARRGKRASIM